jgi:hypothetical protein
LLHRERLDRDQYKIRIWHEKKDKDPVPYWLLSASNRLRFLAMGWFECISPSGPEGLP